ncbi:hypothetical protein FDP41_005155 [Naegleria fowleri]|uniref:Zinc-finger domain-containing protein n=1 Tax=Naegleria fowleri TaxID=5763 RepID=A0A6A5BNU1_NAEFO|nr:uncharacterized protein FDP41_005155 [Naegleria fowleri]KAF0975828.1 hypothetical protein FDP41_005155 [Naegleria fowleri]
MNPQPPSSSHHNHHQQTSSPPPLLHKHQQQHRENNSPCNPMKNHHNTLQHKQFMDFGHEQHNEAMRSQHHESHSSTCHKNSTAIDAVGEHPSLQKHQQQQPLVDPVVAVHPTHAMLPPNTLTTSMKLSSLLLATTPTNTTQEETQKNGVSPHQSTTDNNNNHHYFISHQQPHQLQQVGHARTQPHPHTIYHHPTSMAQQHLGHQQDVGHHHYSSGALGKRLQHGVGVDHHQHYYPYYRQTTSATTNGHWSSSNRLLSSSSHASVLPMNQHNNIHHHENGSSHSMLHHPTRNQQQTPTCNTTIEQPENSYPYQFGNSELSSMAQSNSSDATSSFTGPFKENKNENTQKVSTTVVGGAKNCPPSSLADSSPSLRVRSAETCAASSRPTVALPSPPSRYSTSYVASTEDKKNHPLGYCNNSSQNHHHTQLLSQTLTHFQEPSCIPNNPMTIATNGNNSTHRSSSQSLGFSSDLKHYSYSYASPSNYNNSNYNRPLSSTIGLPSHQHEPSTAANMHASLGFTSHNHDQQQQQQHQHQNGFKWSSVLYKDPLIDENGGTIHPRLTPSSILEKSNGRREEEQPEHLKASTSSPPVATVNTRSVIPIHHHHHYSHLNGNNNHHQHYHSQINNNKQTLKTDVLLRAATTLENHSGDINASNVLVGHDTKTSSEFERNANSSNNIDRGLCVVRNEEPGSQHVETEHCTTIKNPSSTNISTTQNYQQPKKRKLSNNSYHEERNSQNEEAVSSSSESLSVSQQKSESAAKTKATSVASKPSSRTKRSNKIVSYAEYAGDDEDFEQDNSSFSEQLNHSNEYLSESSEELRHKKPKSKKKSSSKDSDFSTKKSSTKKSSNGKIYDSVKGTTCHQCKQKTMDQKSSCKSCLSSPMSSSTNRGSFCASCLKNRYGEELSEVVNNPDWKCPICRGICNCSNCRRKAGKNPISITTREALKSGYQSVHEMLVDRSNE